MSVVVVGQMNITDPMGWQRYVAAVGETLRAFGGELVFRGKALDTFAGAAAQQGIVAIRFIDAQAARRWHDSPDYQALIPLRDASAKVNLALYEI